MFDEHAPKKSEIYDLTTSLLLIVTITRKTIFCKQRSKGVSLLQKSEKDYFANLNEKNITDNKRFWKTVKPFLSKEFILLNK